MSFTSSAGDEDDGWSSISHSEEEDDDETSSSTVLPMSTPTGSLPPPAGMRGYVARRASAAAKVDIAAKIEAEGEAAAAKISVNDELDRRLATQKLNRRLSSRHKTLVEHLPYAAEGSAAAALALPVSAAADAEKATKRRASQWTEHLDPTSGRPFYTNLKGETRWEPPPDLIACPFDGGEWTCVNADGSTASFDGKKMSFAELWEAVADSEIPESALMGLTSIPGHFWPIASIFRRAVTVQRVFIEADADHSGTLSSDEFIAWMQAQGGDQIPIEVGEELKTFQELDEDHDGVISHMEFLAFILHHMNSKVNSPHVAALCHWIDGGMYKSASAAEA